MEGRMGRILAFLLVLVVPGCSAGGAESRRAHERKASRPVIAASVYPLSYLAREAAGDAVRVEDLTPPGFEPHDAELTARQMRAINRADLVVYLGGHFQPVVERAVSGLGDRALDVLAAAHAPDAERHGDGAPSEGRSDQADHPAGEESHVHADPHVWLDPVRMRRVNREIAERLAALDPLHGALYSSRASNTDQTLKKLDRSFATGLSGCRGRYLMTAHGAFGYLAERYGLQQIRIGTGFGEAEPTPARMAKLVLVARSRGIRTIFHERYTSDATARTLSSETGGETAVLDSIEAPPPSGDYISAMRRNLRVLQRGLGCG